MEYAGVGARRTILVTDGDQRAALAIVRSLGAAGYRCIVTSGGRSVAGASRHVDRDIAVPDATLAPAQFVAAIQALVLAERVDLVIPVTEPALLALLRHKERIAASVPFPDLATFSAICDKGRVLEAAKKVGIRTPRQETVTSPGDAARTLDLAFPAVVKAHRSVYTKPDGSRGKVGVLWAFSPGELEEHIASYPDAAFPILVQESIPGPGVGVFVLIHDGELVASFCHRRIREKPPSGGVSVVRQSEPMDRTLLDRSLALLDTFGWSGPAMVEYKRDERTGEAVLMEINGRFWGSLQLAIDAGVDFPRLVAELALGGSPRPVTRYGFVRSRWFWGDVDHLIARWRDPNTSWRGRVAVLLSWIRAFGPGYRAEVFRWTDLRPFLRESIDWVKTVTRR